MGALPRSFHWLANLLAELAQADLYASEGDIESARFVWSSVNQTLGRPADAPIPPQDWSACHAEP